VFRQPLVIAHHLIWTAYGWWLPNDPRGSGSRTIRNDILSQLGELHFGRKKVQPAGRVIREFYARAATLLRHALLSFDDTARQVMASAFADVVAREKLTCWACVIMPDHVHALIRKHKLQAEDMIDRLKAESAARLRTLAPWAGDHPVWGGAAGRYSSTTRTRSAARPPTSSATRTRAACRASHIRSFSPTTAGPFTRVTAPTPRTRKP
jgi:REP element-mobilizing transposase RayT